MDEAVHVWQATPLEVVLPLCSADSCCRGGCAAGGNHTHMYVLLACWPV
jgi:hypothetical protein